jgi:hypothetical protein
VGWLSVVKWQLKARSTIMINEIDEDDDERRRREILADGQSLRVPMAAMDALQRAVADHYGGLEAHRQGYRVVSDQAAEARRRAGYDQMVARSEGLWRSPERVAADTEVAAEVARDQVTLADSRAIRQAAWERMCAAAREAWKNP